MTLLFVSLSLSLSFLSSKELAELLGREFRRAKPKFRLADSRHVRIAGRRLGKQRGTAGFGNARAAQV